MLLNIQVVNLIDLPYFLNISDFFLEHLKNDVEQK